MKQLFFLLTCLWGSILQAQSWTDWFSSEPRMHALHRTAYETHREEGDSVVRVDYQTMVTKRKDGSYVKRVFYPEKEQMITEEVYADAALTIKNGPARYWWDDGVLRAQGRYDNGQSVGEWLTYHWQTHNLIHQGSYAAGKTEGVWKNYHVDGWLYFEVTWEAGKRQGAFTVYDASGAVLNHGQSRADTTYQQTDARYDLEDIRRQGLDGKRWWRPQQVPYMSTFEKIDSIAEREDRSFQALYSIINSNMVYPKVLAGTGASGMVVLMLAIDKNGRIEQVHVRHGICQPFEKEALRLVGLFPALHPAKDKGKVVRCWLYFPMWFEER